MKHLLILCACVLTLSLGVDAVNECPAPDAITSATEVTRPRAPRDTTMSKKQTTPQKEKTKPSKQKKHSKSAAKSK